MRTETLRNGKDIVMGFTSFEVAEIYARENNGEVHSFKKRDGQDWRDEGKIYDAYDLLGFYSDKYSCFHCIAPEDDLGNYYEDCVKGQLLEASTFDDAWRIMLHHQKIMNAMDDCSYDEFILVADGGIEILPKHTTHFSYDVYSWEIGVIIEEE